MGRVADIPAAVVPTVTIEAGTSPFAEGDALRFTVRAAPAPTEDLTVRVSLQESGVMLAAEQPTMVRIAKGRTTATLTVDTMGDDEAELDSTVTATVTSGTGYELGSAVSASVIVTDDDEPGAAGGNDRGGRGRRWPRGWWPNSPCGRIRRRRRTW